APLVEHDHASEGGKPAQEVGVAGQLVEELDVRDDPRHEDEIAGSVTEHLIGDAHVTAPGVARLGKHAAEMRQSVRIRQADAISSRGLKRSVARVSEATMRTPCA